MESVELLCCSEMFQTLGLLPLDSGEDACISQQLAMPKTDGDKARVWILQKQFTDGEKGWLGILA